MAVTATATLAPPGVNAAELPRLDGIEHRYVDLGEVTLHVAEAGDGPPLVLLHGWPQHWWAWRHLIPRLAGDYRVMAVDLRGWGWSSAPPGDYAKSTLAADVVALLDAEGLERVRIIGHDWGGWVAFLLALDHPERVQRMVALDICPPWPPRPRLRHLVLPVWTSYQAVLASPFVGPWMMTSAPGFVRNVIRAGSGPGARWSDEELDAYADVLRDPARARATTAGYRHFLTRELPAMMLRGKRGDDLHVPTLLALGRASPFRVLLTPQPADNLQMAIVDGAGHFLPEEAPDEVLALAGPFLDDGGQARAH